MKCAICEEKTTWNKSYGRSEFLVCENCFNKLRKEKGLIKALDMVCEIGQKIEKIKEEVLTNPKGVL